MQSIFCADGILFRRGKNVLGRNDFAKILKILFRRSFDCLGRGGALRSGFEMADGMRSTLLSVKFYRENVYYH